jgi:cytosine/adenosine deaminase-related metal-dependent hydrolase
MPHELTRYLELRAAAAMDARDVACAPAALLLRLEGALERPGSHGVPATAGRITLLAVGRPGEVRTHPDAARAHVVDLPATLLLPGLVNPHTHLDLTHIGPRPFVPGDGPGAGFAAWVDMIRRERRTEAQTIAASVAEGVRLSRAGGVVAVGDIAGAVSGVPSAAAARALRHAGMAGTSYIEFFAVGAGWESRVRAALQVHAQAAAEADGGPVLLGIQPHAPYSVLARAYERALRGVGQPRGSPDVGSPAPSCTHLACTHLGETVAEHELIAHGRGPLADFLERLGLFDQITRAEFGHGRSPVEHLEEVIARHGPTLVHLNHLSDRDISVLASACTRFHRLTGRRICAVCCPRASAYFHPGRPFAHRWRQIRDAGLRVSLGTDSIVTLDTPDRLSPLDEARWVAQTAEGPDERRALLGMITTEAAAVAGIPEESVTFSTAGQTLAGVVGVEVEGPVHSAQSGWEECLRTSARPELLLLSDTITG